MILYSKEYGGNMINWDKEDITLGKKAINLNNHKLRTALELESYPSNDHYGFMLDATADRWLTQPLGLNDVNVSGFFSPNSKVLEFLKAKPGSVQEYVDELKANRSQYYLHQIMVSKDLRGEGVGTKMMELSEYLFAKYMMKVGEKSGFITGTFCPIGEEEEKVRGFYDKNGFIITETDELFKDILVEEVMDRDNRLEFEKIF